MSPIERPSAGPNRKERWAGEERDIEAEREKLRREIKSFRDEADDLERRFEEIARGRAEINYARRLNAGK